MVLNIILCKDLFDYFNALPYFYILYDVTISGK